MQNAPAASSVTTRRSSSGSARIAEGGVSLERHTARAERRDHPIADLRDRGDEEAADSGNPSSAPCWPDSAESIRVAINPASAI